jgi:hypothetical protein
MMVLAFLAGMLAMLGVPVLIALICFWPELSRFVTKRLAAHRKRRT